MLRKLVLYLLANIGGLWFAIRFVPQVDFEGPIQYFIIAGVILGLLNAILRPILNLSIFPIRIITFGLSSFLINAFMVFAVDVIFQDLVIIGINALLITTTVVWGVSMFIMFFGRRKSSI